jgi:5'-3' exonuclease
MKKKKFHPKKQTKKVNDETNILSKSTKWIDSKVYLDFDLWKENYYKIKMNLNYSSKEDRLKVLESYIDGLSWNFKYYFYGCPSWDWFYPFYYSPLLSDFEIMEEYKPKYFIKGSPIKPVEQLLSVLPPRGSYLLPLQFQHFFNHEKLTKFYPRENVKLDFEFSKWEPVKILPFIEMEELISVLKNEVKEYSTFGNVNQTYHFTWNEDVSYFYFSTMERLPDIEECHVECKKN